MLSSGVWGFSSVDLRTAFSVAICVSYDPPSKSRLFAKPLMNVADT